jgi:hypothetical protein
VSVFIESLSSDPIERAIAARVSRILADRSISASRRETLVRQAQRDLIQHRERRDTRQQVQAIAAKATMPTGYTAKAVQVVSGRVVVAATHQRSGMRWIDAGPAPDGITDAIAQPIGGKRATRRQGPALNPIEQRRRELRR